MTAKPFTRNGFRETISRLGDMASAAQTLTLTTLCGGQHG